MEFEELQQILTNCRDNLNYLLTSKLADRDYIESLLWIETALFRARIKLEREFNR